MSIIKAYLSKNANYIYHMLSVSKCGYDNIYGSEYKKFHNTSDLEKLKRMEKYLTVSGGKYSGQLYGICVSIPASIEDDDSLEEYFNGIIDLFKNEQPQSNFDLYKNIYQDAFSAFDVEVNIDSHEEFFNRYKSLGLAIIDICRILAKNYIIYCEEIWGKSFKELNNTVSVINNLLYEHH